jgi:hypothetical protein
MFELSSIRLWLDATIVDAILDLTEKLKVLRLRRNRRSKFSAKQKQKQKQKQNSLALRLKNLHKTCSLAQLFKNS